MGEYERDNSVGQAPYHLKTNSVAMLTLARSKLHNDGHLYNKTDHPRPPQSRERPCSDEKGETDRAPIAAKERIW